ncbi:MAG: cysteine desulfurase family protein [Siphonobacter sp.]
MSIYCDYSATTPLSPQVLQSMLPYFTEQFGNASASHRLGRQAKVILDNSRKKIADLLNVTPSDIIFTSGGTEADNLALKGSIQKWGIRHVITSKIEHKAVLNPLKQSAVEIHYVALDEKGQVQISDLIRLLQQYPNSLVSLMHANNELGNILDIEIISELCKRYKAYFHSDTVQTMGKLPIPLSYLDWATASAHKFRGPKGVGFLYASRSVSPVISGGGQENGLRGGTENIANIVGLTTALELSLAKQAEVNKHLGVVKAHFLKGLKSLFPHLTYNGNSESVSNSLPGLINIRFPHVPNGESLVRLLDEAGIYVSGGSACSNLAGGSHVLQALPGTAGHENVRFSFGSETTLRNVNTILSQLAAVYHQQPVFA